MEQSLEQYTKVKTIKELESEVGMARADELAREADYERLRASGLGILW